MSRRRRWLAAGAAVLLALGFAVIWLLQPPAIGVGAFAASGADPAADVIMSILAHSTPIALALALAFLIVRPLLRQRRESAEVLRLDASALDVDREIEQVEDKRQAVVTHRFSCPVCGGIVVYVEGVLPITCDVDRRHSWPHERAMWDELIAIGNRAEADRLATIVAQRASMA